MAGIDWLMGNGLQPVNPAQDLLKMQAQGVPPALSDSLTPEQIAELIRLQEEKKKKSIVMSGPPPQTPPIVPPVEAAPPVGIPNNTVPLELQAMLNQDRTEGRALMNRQGQGIEQQQQMLQDFQKMPTQASLAPLAGLADAWTGSHLAPIAKDVAGMTADEKAQAVMKLQDMIQSQRNNLSKDAVNFSSMNGLAKLQAAAMTGQNRIENTAQREFRGVINNKEIAQQIGQHQQAAKDLSLLNTSIHSGKGMPLQTLSEITQGLGNLVVLAKSTTGFEREKQDYHNLNTSVAELVNRLKTQGVAEINDPVLFRQLAQQIQRLHDANQQLLKSSISKQIRPTNNPYIDAQQRAAVKNLFDQIDQNNTLFAPPKEGSVLELSPDIIEAEMLKRMGQ